MLKNPPLTLRFLSKLHGPISYCIVKLHKAQPFESESLDRLAETMKADAILKRDKCSRYYKARPFSGGCMSFSEVIIFDAKYYDMLLPEEVLAVGAHEFNHIAKRHVLRRLPRTLLPALIISSVIGGIISINPVLVSASPLIGQIGYGLSVPLSVVFSLLFFLIVSFYVNAKWLRQQETECDLSAVEFAYGEAMISALTKFRQRFPRKNWDLKIAKFFPQTYPTLEQRIAEIKSSMHTKDME